ncbi:MAG TPA: 2-phosphosulfolactate phosphatase [Steroidobacteraceae bacterium]|nr:2-phosphosulfolactate phosphatase [Steroidobacteraceae bacterium]HRX89610.1 2-phosphosulfolactate phosphatase [Steroidobacteraceae bacterium]
MQVEVVDFVAGAARAQGVAIVVDVFRACTVAAVAIAQGAAAIVPVAEVATARALRTRHADWLLVGERYARKLPGFDAGNSPTEIASLDVVGRTLIHTTHAGTQGLTAAARVADAVFTGAFVNMSATVRAVRSLTPHGVTIVRMGREATARSQEDDLCAEWFAALLCGERDLAPGRAAIAAALRNSEAAGKFFDPAADWAPAADFDACTAVDAYDFALYLTTPEKGSAAAAEPEIGVLRRWARE